MTSGYLKFALAVVTLALVGAGVLSGQTATRPASSPATCASTTTTADFTIASYNINYGNPDLKTVAETIRKGGADVVALQEINDASAGFLRRSLSGVYPHTSFRPDPGAGGFGFLSKVPLAEVKYLDPPAGRFGAYFCQVKLSNRTLVVADVHLLPTLPRQDEKLLDLLKRYSSDEQVRMKEIQAILKTLPRDSPAIVLGDLNSLPILDTKAFVEQQGFVEARACQVGATTEPATWHWKSGRANYRLRLDYIFLSRQFSPADFRILENDASDHFLVIAGVAWKTSTTAPSGNPR